MKMDSILFRIKFFFVGDKAIDDRLDEIENEIDVIEKKLQKIRAEEALQK